MGRSPLSVGSIRLLRTVPDTGRALCTATTTASRAVSNGLGERKAQPNGLCEWLCAIRCTSEQERRSRLRPRSLGWRRPGWRRSLRPRPLPRHAARVSRSARPSDNPGTQPARAGTDDGGSRTAICERFGTSTARRWRSCVAECCQECAGLATRHDALEHNPVRDPAESVTASRSVFPARRPLGSPVLGSPAASRCITRSPGNAVR